MDRRTVDRIALLARLDLTQEERQTFTRQLGEVIAYAEMLNELDTADVLPFMHASAQANVFRDDSPADSLRPEAATANAPLRQGDFFHVPRVVDGGDG